MLKDFLSEIEKLQIAEDERTGRDLGRDSFGHIVRRASRYLTYVFYKMHLKGPQILTFHFLCDSIALTYVYVQKPYFALLFWALGHLLDNCDGDLARIRKEAAPNWGKIDIMLHLFSNMLFWAIIYFQSHNHFIVVILACRVIAEALRKQVGIRYGQRSRFFMLLTLPVNVNWMYLIFVALPVSWFIHFYFIYYLVTTLGQLAVYFIKTRPKKEKLSELSKEEHARNFHKDKLKAAELELELYLEWKKSYGL